MSLAQLKRMIMGFAIAYGVDPMLALEICRLESSFRPEAVGDEGKAVGLWQWHLKSWDHVRLKMGIIGDDMRAWPRESTLAAMYAMGELDLYRWWSTYPIAMTNLGKEMS